MSTAPIPRVAVIDTNIIDYAFKPRTKMVAAEVMLSLSKRYTLVISEYLRFEIYRGLAMDKVPRAKSLVDSFTAYSVDKSVLDIAAALTTCYESDEQTKSRRSSFSDGDVILAATAFKYKFVVATANRSDFPAPYFKEFKEYKLPDARNKPWAFYELKPDVEYFNSMLNICYPKMTKG